MKASPSPSEGGDVPNGVSKGGEKADRRGTCPYFVATLLMGEKKPHPQPLSEWRGGVDSIIYKQRGRFFDVKRRPFHGKETPSSMRRGRFFN